MLLRRFSYRNPVKQHTSCIARCNECRRIGHFCRSKISSPLRRHLDSAQQTPVRIQVSVNMRTSVFILVALFLLPTEIECCRLNCENGGYCQQIQVDDKIRAVRSGELVERCVCPTDNQGLKLFAGMGCDIPVDDSARDFDECELMDYVSPLAGRMCRHPYTDYCSSEIKANPPYCTNGGKCRGDLIAASVAPGDTAANSLYEEAGCLCPKEFYGPHCEFFHFPDHDVSSLKMGSKQTRAEKPEKSSSVTSSYNPLSAVEIEDMFNDAFNDSSDNRASSSLRNRLHLLWIPVCLAFASVGISVSFYINQNARRHRRLLELVEKAVTTEQLDESYNTAYSASDHMPPFVIPEDMSISENQVRSLLSSSSSSMPYSFSESETKGSLVSVMSSFSKFFL